jgi:hypothetical protein
MQFHFQYSFCYLPWIPCTFLQNVKHTVPPDAEAAGQIFNLEQIGSSHFLGCPLPKLSIPYYKQKREYFERCQRIRE